MIANKTPIDSFCTDSCSIIFQICNMIQNLLSFFINLYPYECLYHRETEGNETSDHIKPFYGHDVPIKLKFDYPHWLKVVLQFSDISVTVAPTVDSDTLIGAIWSIKPVAVVNGSCVSLLSLELFVSVDVERKFVNS